MREDRSMRTWLTLLLALMMAAVGAGVPLSRGDRRRRRSRQRGQGGPVPAAVRPGSTRRHTGARRRPRLAGGPASIGGTRLGTPGHHLRPGPPRRRPHRGPRHPGPRGRSRPCLLRGPGRGPWSRLGGTERHGRPTPAHDLRAGAGDGEEGRGGGGGRGDRRTGTDGFPLPGVLPALGTAPGRHLPGPPVPAAAVAAQPGSVTAAAGPRSARVRVPTVPEVRSPSPARPGPADRAAAPHGPTAATGTTPRPPDGPPCSSSRRRSA